MSGRIALVFLIAPVLGLGVVWSVDLWRRVMLSRSQRLARQTGELELRLRTAHGELGEWERRAMSAAAALAEVSAALPRDISVAERRIDRLADELRQALAMDVAGPLRVLPSTRYTASRPRPWRPVPIARERSA
jgi:hypothetical protein